MNKQTIDKVERRLLAEELDASTTTLADVLPDTARAAFAGYGISGKMSEVAWCIKAFTDALKSDCCRQFRRENPKLYEAVWAANDEVEELRFCKNVAVESEMPPIFTGLLADFYGITPDAESGKKRNGEESLKPVHAIIVGEQADMLKRIEAGQGALLDGQSKQNEFIIGLGLTANEIDRNTRPTTPRPDDYEVSQPDAARILTDAGYKVSKRQIQNWDRFIKTNGTKGTRPPDGYRIELRAQYLIFKAWAENTAKSKRMKTALRQRRQRAHKTNV